MCAVPWQQVLALVYFCKLTRVPAQRWSYEQKWIGGILVGLMFFNNPLLAMEIYKCVARGRFSPPSAVRVPASQ